MEAVFHFKFLTTSILTKTVSLDNACAVCSMKA